jgi:hypothetical protein
MDGWELGVWGTSIRDETKHTFIHTHRDRENETKRRFDGGAYGQGPETSSSSSSSSSYLHIFNGIGDRGHGKTGTRAYRHMKKRELTRT